MIGRPRRLVVVGSVIADIKLAVPQLPDRGGDVLAASAASRPGGGFNVLAAAARLGLPAALAGHVGSGPFAAMIRAALAAEGIDVLLPPVEGEQGYCVGLVEPDGQNTFVTAPGVESRLTEQDLAGVSVGAGDVLYVSGYDLLYPVSGPALAAWLTGPAAECWLFLDPGPLVADIPDPVMDAVLPRVDVLGLNTREMALLSGTPSQDRVGALRGELADDAVVLIRDGEHGTMLVRPGRSLVRVPAPHVSHVVDTTGAGDTHTGAFLAELARGAADLDGLAGDAGVDAAIEEAVRVANVAAAMSIRVDASAGCPGRADLARALAGTAAVG